MKNKKIINYDYIISYDIINLLLFENSVLQKKINNENLTPKEQLFDSFIVSPSFMLRQLIKIVNRKESDNYRV